MKVVLKVVYASLIVENEAGVFTKKLSLRVPSNQAANLAVGAVLAVGADAIEVAVEKVCRLLLNVKGPEQLEDGDPKKSYKEKAKAAFALVKNAVEETANKQLEPKQALTTVLAVSIDTGVNEAVEGEGLSTDSQLFGFDAATFKEGTKEGCYLNFVTEKKKTPPTGASTVVDGYYSRGKETQISWDTSMKSE